MPELKRRTRRWSTARRAVQYTALLGFLTLFVATRGLRWDPSLVNVPLRLDPLAMLAQSLASRVLLTSAALALLTLALTLVLGRAWCGWLCPLGTTLDLVPLRRWRSNRKPPPESWRAAKHVVLLIILSAALLGNLTLLILDPLTLLYRSLTTSLWPALDQAVNAAEITLYRAPLLRGALSTLDGWIRPAILPSQPQHYREAFFVAALLAVVVVLNVVAERFWCRYLCPLGGLLGWVSKFALVRRQTGSACPGCDLCAKACPTGTIDPARGYASDAAECTMCLDCLEVCPRGEVQFPLRFPAPEWLRYDPNRRQALLALGGAAVGIVLVRSERGLRRNALRLIRPPGVREDDLLRKCVRCGICTRACPTAGLQPAWTEAGLEGLWTPVLIPRVGCCDYACNRCGLACPTQAIPPLSLEDKRLEVIGRARIDRDRCLAWADFGACIVCEEMCPLPEKAILLEAYTGPNPLRQVVSIQRPHVLEDRCIGCGICEYKCPVAGEAAIRVETSHQA